MSDKIAHQKLIATFIKMPQGKIKNSLPLMMAARCGCSSLPTIATINAYFAMRAYLSISMNVDVRERCTEPLLHQLLHELRHGGESGSA